MPRADSLGARAAMCSIYSSPTAQWKGDCALHVSSSGKSWSTLVLIVRPFSPTPEPWRRSKARRLRGPWVIVSKLMAVGCSWAGIRNSLLDHGYVQCDGVRSVLVTIRTIEPPLVTPTNKVVRSEGRGSRQNSGGRSRQLLFSGAAERQKERAIQHRTLRPGVAGRIAPRRLGTRTGRDRRPRGAGM